MKRNMKKFVKEKFPEEQEKKVVETFDMEMERIVSKERKELSKRDFKVACNSIFDQIVAYQAFQRYVSPEEAKDYCKEYFYDQVVGLRNLLHFLNRTTIGAGIFKKMFVQGLKKGPLKYQLKTYNKKCLIFDIQGCLYRDLCEKYQCGELTALFCNGDHFLFDDMKKLDFQRSQTLGEGGNLCDFHFYNR